MQVELAASTGYAAVITTRAARRRCWSAARAHASSRLPRSFAAFPRPQGTPTTAPTTPARAAARWAGRGPAATPGHGSRGLAGAGALPGGVPGECAVAAGAGQARGAALPAPGLLAGGAGRWLHAPRLPRGGGRPQLCLRWLQDCRCARRGRERAAGGAMRARAHTAAPAPPRAGWQSHPVSRERWHFVVPSEVRRSSRALPAAARPHAATRACHRALHTRTLATPPHTRRRAPTLCATPPACARSPRRWGEGSAPARQWRCRWATPTARPPHP